MADVIAMYVVADVKATEADVIASCVIVFMADVMPICMWQML